MEMRRQLIAATDVRFVTTDGVLGEVLTRFAPFGETSRLAAVRFVRALAEDPRLEIVPLDRALFLAGLDLYEKRLDKAYRVDCMSMVVCRERDIAEVFTADHNFEQEGLRILL